MANEESNKELNKLGEKLKAESQKLEALIKLSKDIRNKSNRIPISFNDFLNQARLTPKLIFRDIFQLVYDMFYHYVPQGVDEYGEQKQSIGYLKYNFEKLFRKDCDNPFFADRLFANRFVKLIDSFRYGTQHNRIYLFEGPPGSGKSTFLNNFLDKLEQYSNASEGIMYKTYWVLDIDKLGGYNQFEKEIANTGNTQLQMQIFAGEKTNKDENKYLKFSCPNHDHPILQIPKSFRRKFLDELIPDSEFKDYLFTAKEYEWIFKDIPCSICNSLHNVLLDKLNEPLEVFDMIYARKMVFNRQLGDGISVFNPGDPIYNNPIRNNMLQDKINHLLKKTSVQYVYSYLAKTNNGVYGLMDIKENNITRLQSLHGIISDGIHKVDLIEEKVKSFFVGLINPTDKSHYENIPSFKDRIITIKIPYILDYNTEVQVYKNKFGNDIENKFLPLVLHNIAKIIISSRLKRISPAINSWIKDKNKYNKYLDEDRLLLKMDIYTGKIPEWLDEEELKNLDTKTRKAIINEALYEGEKGFSGRQSISIFSELLDKAKDKNKLISMKFVGDFFLNNTELKKEISVNFINSITKLYNYNVLQEVKESIYNYNKEQVYRDIKNYLFAINYEPEVSKKSIFTGDKIEITEDYFKNFEAIILGATSTPQQRKEFRKDILKKYITTIAKGITNNKIEESDLFVDLFNKYIRNLKENALYPFVNNENFRRAILDYKTTKFKNYDKKIKDNVKFLINNLMKKFNYNEHSAKQIVIYVLDNKLAGKF